MELHFLPSRFYPRDSTLAGYQVSPDYAHNRTVSESATSAIFQVLRTSDLVVIGHTWLSARVVVRLHNSDQFKGECQVGASVRHCRKEGHQSWVWVRLDYIIARHCRRRCFDQGRVLEPVYGPVGGGASVKGLL